MLIELSKEWELNEDTNSSWIQAFPYGKYSHPRYGTIKMDKDLATQAARNFADKVTEVDLHIDYNHKNGPAAGWVHAVEARDDGLYLDVKWTEEAVQEIKTNKYRYFSPTYAERWKHPKNRSKHESVLLGGALTNSPYLRDIKKIQLEEGDMPDLEDRLRKLMKLEDGDDIVTAVKGHMESNGAPKSKDSELIKTLNDAGLSDVIVKLEQQNKMIDTLVLANKLSEATVKVERWTSAKNALPAASAEKVKELMLMADSNLRIKVVELFDELSETGLISQEAGSVKPSSGGEKSVLTFSDAVDKYAADNKVDYAIALEAVSRTQPALFDEHRRSLLGKESA